MEQRSTEWFEARLGMFTGSVFADVLAVSKRDKKPLKERENLIWRLATERINGCQARRVEGQALRWGTEAEQGARETYELETGLVIEDAGFIRHPLHYFVGCSPDGLVEADGGVEIKSPFNSDIHMRRFLDGMPEEFKPQVQGCMWVTGRKWWDFVSFDPNAAPSFQLLVIRQHREDEYIAELERQVIDAEREVSALVDQLMATVLQAAA